MKAPFRLLRAVAAAAVLLTASCSYDREELMEQAASGDAGAQYELGRRLLTGQKGFTTDPAMALAWLKQAALQGNTHAMAATGICYERGLGTAPSVKEAEHWYNQALDAGNMNACIPLARLAIRQGNAADLAHALTPPAERGATAAQMMLATLYLNDPAREKQELGVRYLRFAAMQGNAEACLRMGLCYAAGKGVQQNDLLAQGWFENAKEAGSGRMAALIRAAEEE